jgi:hypothetical protein
MSSHRYPCHFTTQCAIPAFSITSDHHGTQFSRMSFPEAQVSIWVDAILHRGERDLSFDELYFASIEAVGAGRSQDFLWVVRSSFEVAIAQFQAELAEQPTDSFTIALQDLCEFIVNAVEKLAAAFWPLTLAIPDLNLTGDLLDLFKMGIFESSDSLGRMDGFLVSYAQLLPGSVGIETHYQMIDLLLNFLRGTGKWKLFVRHLVEGTEAYCNEICSAAMERVAGSSDILVYLGVVIEVLENEQKLWSRLPSELVAQLRTMCLNCLIYSMKTNFLFAESSERIWGSVFFEDLRNLETFGALCETLFAESELQNEILAMILKHFHAKLQRLLGEVSKNMKSPAVVERVCEMLIDTFERVDLLSARMRNVPQTKSVLDSLRQTLLQDPSLKIAKTLTVYIDRVIGMICDHPRNVEENHYRIRQCARITAFLPNRHAFMKHYHHSMNRRLCQRAGRQYKVEEMVLAELQRYLPPALSIPFKEMAGELAESDVVNEKWRADNPESPLQVLILSAVKSAPFVTAYAHVRLPEPFVSMQQQFALFYRQQTDSGKIRFQWVFEDNVVTFRLVNPEKYDVLLKVPLLLGIVLVLIHEYRDITVDKIAKLCGLDMSNVQSLVDGSTSLQFPLIWISRGGAIHFNRLFTTHARKYSIVHPRFSLPRPPKSVPESVQDESLTRVQYQVSVMAILKANKTVEERKLEVEAQKRLQQHGIPFRPDQYGRALLFLEANECIRRDPTRPANWLFVP